MERIGPLEMLSYALGGILGLAGFAAGFALACRRSSTRGVREVLAALRRDLAERGNLAARIVPPPGSGPLAREGAETANRFAAGLQKMAQDARVRSARLAHALTATTSAMEEVARKVEERSQHASAVRAATQEATEIVGTCSELAEGLSRSTRLLATAIEEMERSFTSIDADVGEVFSSVHETTASLHELSTASEQIGQSAAELRESAQQGGNAVSQLNDAIQHIEGQAVETEALVHSMDERVQEGLGRAGQARAAIDAMVVSVDTSDALTHALVARAEEIEGMLGLISEVANRTRMLALNAAILAARLGESGRPVSVVAREMSELAETAGSSAGEIDRIFHGLREQAQESASVQRQTRERVEEGTRLVGDVEEALRAILASASDSRKHVGTIRATLAEQARQSERLTGLVQGNADRVGEIARAVSEQNESLKLAIAMAERVRSLGESLREASSRAASQVSRLNGEGQRISATAEELDGAANTQRGLFGRIEERIQGVSGTFEETATTLVDTAREMAELRRVSERVENGMAHLRTGCDADRFRELAEATAQQTSRLLERLLADGRSSARELFEPTYRPRADGGTHRFDTEISGLLIEKVGPLLEEAYRRAGSTAIFVALMDRGGLMIDIRMTNREEYRIAGESDSRSSRLGTLRKDPVTQAAVRNREPFLFQVYTGRSGLTMHEVAVPIFVAGRHFGAVRLGFRPEFVESTATAAGAAA